MLVVFRVVSPVARELDVLFSLFFVVYVLHACARVNLPLISASYPAPGDRKNRRREGGGGSRWQQSRTPLRMHEKIRKCTHPANAHTLTHTHTLTHMY